jgi:hypothetical protein
VARIMGTLASIEDDRKPWHPVIRVPADMPGEQVAVVVCRQGLRRAARGRRGRRRARSSRGPCPCCTGRRTRLGWPASPRRAHTLAMETSWSGPVPEILEGLAGECLLPIVVARSADHCGNPLVNKTCPSSYLGTPRWTNRVVTTPWVGPWPCKAGSASCRGARDRRGPAWVGGGVPDSTSLAVNSGRQSVPIAHDSSPTRARTLLVLKSRLNGA